MDKIMKEMIEKDVNFVMSDACMNELLEKMKDDGVKMSYFYSLLESNKDELKKRLIKIAPLYRIDLETAFKINRKLARLKWEEENDDLINTDKDPYYVEDMKSGKYKNKKEYYWKNYRVIIDEADEAAENE